MLVRFSIIHIKFICLWSGQLLIARTHVRMSNMNTYVYCICYMDACNIFFWWKEKHTKCVTVRGCRLVGSLTCEKHRRIMYFGTPLPVSFSLRNPAERSDNSNGCVLGLHTITRSTSRIFCCFVPARKYLAHSYIERIGCPFSHSHNRTICTAILSTCTYSLHAHTHSRLTYTKEHASERAIALSLTSQKYKQHYSQIKREEHREKKKTHL